MLLCLLVCVLYQRVADNASQSVYLGHTRNHADWRLLVSMLLYLSTSPAFYGWQGFRR